MPAKTMLFDQRVRTVHDFGSSPHNFISFNPQSRLIALAGFGNLAGKTDIFDRRSLSKVCTIDAPNTSWCEWSPDGRFLLTATLSPRLRVDNGIKIWHCSGSLMHVQNAEELYQASWRPTPVEGVPQFGQGVPPAPVPSESVRNMEVSKPVAARPAGAYRPPGARGLATPAIFKREDEGGAARVPTNGTATPPRAYNRSPAPGQVNGMNGYNGMNGHNGMNGQNVYQNGGGGGNAGRRHVPGAAHGAGMGPEGEKKNRKRKGKKDGEAQEKRRDGGGGENTEQAVEDGGETPLVDVEVVVNGHGNDKVNGSVGVQPNLVVDVDLVPATPGLDSSLDPVAKKVRNLNKKVLIYYSSLTGLCTDYVRVKLKAIDELKEKAKRGERLEATQLKKIDGEAEIRKELAGLGMALSP